MSNTIGEDTGNPRVAPLPRITFLWAPDERPGVVIVETQGDCTIILLNCDDFVGNFGTFFHHLTRALGIDASIDEVQVSPAELAGSDTWNWEEVAEAWCRGRGRLQTRVRSVQHRE
jgi:hypothetical protein